MGMPLSLPPDMRKQSEIQAIKDRICWLEWQIEREKAKLKKLDGKL